MFALRCCLLIIFQTAWKVKGILKRIQNQWTDEERISKSDYFIHNITINETKKQVDEILKKLNNL